MSLLPTSTVRCLQCARPAGRIVNSVFVPDPSGPRPLTRRSGSRCGSCGAGLYLEPEGATTPRQAAYVAAARSASAHA